MQNKISIKKLHKSDYPPLLKEIRGLPDTFDYAGTLPPYDYKFLCVVGSRKYTEYGREACRKLIMGLQGYPIVIVSGLAFGIDSIAHEAALAASLTTISFPGSGLSLKVLYPSPHRGLAMKIIEKGGALFSSFNVDQEAAPWTFPTRNTWMAGISHATLIVEGSKSSGTIITGEQALNFSRDVLVVPGSIFSESSYGPHMLIRRGATPVSSSADILQALGFAHIRSDGMDSTLPNYAEMSLTDEQRKIIDYLRFDNLSSTDLISKTGFSPSKFNLITSELELLGLISQANGNYRLV